MKPTSALLALALALASSAVSAAPQRTQSVQPRVLRADTWTSVAQSDFIVTTSGYTYSPLYDFISGPASVSAVKVTLSNSLGGACLAGLYSLEVFHTRGQPVATRYFPDARGIFTLPSGSTITSVMALLYQTTPFASACHLDLSLAASTGGTPDDTDPTADFHFAGVAHYTGGFRGDLDIPVNGSRIHRLWVRIPDFCDQVEVLDAGLVSEGHYDPATLIDTANVFEVAGGAGARASALRISLNGPIGMQCDVPVYVQAD